MSALSPILMPLRGPCRNDTLFCLVNAFWACVYVTAEVAESLRLLMKLVVVPSVELLSSAEPCSPLLYSLPSVGSIFSGLFTSELFMLTAFLTLPGLRLPTI